MICWSAAVSLHDPAAIASAVAADSRLPADAVVAHRSSPGGIAIAGTFTSDQWLLLDVLRVQLELTDGRVRRWTWDDVHRGTARLGSIVANDATTASLGGVARGGLIVATLAAYAAGREVEVATPEGSGWVLDDIALSAHRLLELLDQRGRASTHVGLLAATDGAFAALEGHPAVVSVHRVESVRDRTAESVDPDELRRRWATPDDRRWHGRSDHHVFPWHEPDFVIHHPETGEVITGFPLAPSEWCIATGEPRVPVVPVVEDLDPVLAPHAWPVDHDGSLLVLDTSTGAVARLGGSARELLETLGPAHPRDALVTLAERFGVGLGVVRSDRDELLAGLAERGLLAARISPGRR